VNNTPFSPAPCDLWAFGLLCWEAALNGGRYYKQPCIQKLLLHHVSSAKGGSASGVIGMVSEDTEESESMFCLIAKHIRTSALEDVSIVLGPPQGDMRLSMFQATLKSTLNVDPEKRSGSPITVFVRDM
jgi:hypothetical protein